MNEMIKIFSRIIIAALITLTAFGIVFIDVYQILKLTNYETDVDMIKFDKCILPYKMWFLVGEFAWYLYF